MSHVLTIQRQNNAIFSTHEHIERRYRELLPLFQSMLCEWKRSGRAYMNVFEIECESAREIKLKPFAIKERKGHEMLFM